MCQLFTIAVFKPQLFHLPIPNIPNIHTTQQPIPYPFPSVHLANLQKAIALGQTPQQGELDLIEDQRHAAILPGSLLGSGDGPWDHVPTCG